jgi:hypothetical protein
MMANISEKFHSATQTTRQKGYRMSSTVAFLTVYYILGEL